MAASTYANTVDTTLSTSTHTMSTHTTSTHTTSSVAKASFAPVQLLPQTVQGAHIKALAHAPKNLKSTTKAFLSAYQPYSTVANNFTGFKNGDKFSSTGHCFSEYPCFSVNHGAVASVGTKPKVTSEQMSALLDSVLAAQYVTFDQTHHDKLSTGFKTTKNGATLEVIVPAGILPSFVLAGMAFDIFKLQPNNTHTNSGRVMQASSEIQQNPDMAFCAYPDLGSNQADVKAMQNFCVEKELDGSVIKAKW